MKTKAHIVLVAVMALFTAAKAQNVNFGESFVLDSALNSNQSHEYTANDHIELKKGFFSEPILENHTALQIDAELNCIFPPEEGLTNSNGCVVGSLGGTVNVSAMGGLLYSIPLEIPSGINGMQPKLAITYNSQAGNDVLGWGWGLDGLSSITRTGQTLYHDGKMTAADLSMNDRFLLDGKRLIEVADYTDSIEFRTEQDEMSRIVAYITHTSVGGKFGSSIVDVVDHFVVWKVDGIIMEYGATDDSWIEPQNGGDQALCWLLNRVSDRNGNAIVYHYHEDQAHGVYYIQFIEYTQNESQSTQAQFVIAFEFSESRPDYEQYYIYGNMILLRQRLTGINVKRKTSMKPLYRYDFKYKYPYNNHYSRLDTIRMTSYDSCGMTERYNATLINWNTIDPEVTGQYTISNPAIFKDFSFTGDFNGDGYSDIAVVPYKDSITYVGSVELKIYLNNRNAGFTYMPSMSLTGLSPSLDWVHVLDINGDGLDDLVPYFYDTVPAQQTEETSIKVFLNNPSDQRFDLVGQKTIQNKGDVILGDFDGNGNSDVILLEKKHGNIPYGNNQMETDYVENVFYLGYQGSQLVTRKLNGNSLKTLGPVYNALSADFDGDGISEVLLVSINETANPYGGTKIGTFIFDNSNNCFLVKQYCNGYYYPDYNPSVHRWCHIFPGDYNGDGKTDLLFYNGNWNLSMSEGNGISTPHSMYNSGLPALSQGINLFYPSLRLLKDQDTNPYLISVSVGDFDGDGGSDICYFDKHNSIMRFSSKITLLSSNYVSFSKHFSVGSGMLFHSQYIPTGNYLGKENMSFICSFQPSNGTGDPIAKIYSLFPVNQYNSVTSITDGLGNQTTFTYDCLTPKASGATAPFYSFNYSAPDTYGMRPMPLPVRALKTFSVEGVNNSKAITRYSYQNAMYHKNGHGFMGFITTVAETYHNSTDSVWTTRKVTWNEKTTMGQHATLLPQCDTVYVNHSGVKRMTGNTQYNFTKVKYLSGLTDLVVCPAMISRTEKNYSMDGNDERIAIITTNYQYNYNGNQNHTYSGVYGCTSSTQTVTGYDHGNSFIELQTEKQTELQTISSSWIVNRPVCETVTSTRNNETVSSTTCFTYLSRNSYQPDSITVIPNNGDHPDDPLTLLASYEYDDFGNVVETKVEAPYGIQGEIPRIVSYEYGGYYQHRLPTKETKGSPNNGYITSYSYDFHDRPILVTDCNGKRIKYSTSVLGTDQSVFHPDGTEQKSQILWASQSPYKPTGACYYTWTKKTGGITSMTFYHKSGAELRSVTFDFQGDPVFTDKHYNAKGLLESESVPYKMGELAENIQWTVYHYDVHDRLTSVEYPDGSAKSIVYNGLVTTTTMTPPQGSPVMTPQTTVMKANALGWLSESVDADGTSVFYEYYADGNLKYTRVGTDNTTKISMQYDHARNRTRLHDPDYCTAQKDLVSVYNAFGEEVRRTTPRNYATTFTYDELGRLIQRTEGSKTTVWNYGQTTPNKGLLLSVTYPGQTLTYGYDTCQRVTSETVQFSASETYVTQYAYDGASRIASVTYPSGVTVNHRYNPRGYPSAQTDGNGNELYRTKETTPMGQTKRFVLGGVMTNTLEYDPEKHLLTRIKTQKNATIVQNFSYDYDGFCNLASRKDDMRNLEETFTYDHQNRLTGIWLGTTQSGAMTYDSYGRMTAKTASGHTVFSNAVFNLTAKPHALDAATTDPDLFPATPQTVTYTRFDKASKIKQGNDSVLYTYGYDHQRIRMQEYIRDTVRTKRYVGNCEKVKKTTGNTSQTRWHTYLSSPIGVFAVVVTENGTNTIHYILKDNLGSWTTITDSEGFVEQRLSYDAWGNLRNPSTWSDNFNETPMFDRGFTCHEHLYSFGLINMNGRMYDPVMSSFLSVDQYVSSPENAQGFNRYAYCMNNPLSYVDPSGWRPVGGGHGYTPNTATNDPYAYVENRYLEPRDLGIRELSTSDPIITWMEENSLHGGGNGAKGGGFYDEKGKYWGTLEGVNEKVYVIRSEKIERSIQREIKKFLNGNKSSITEETIFQYFIEIEPSQANRQRMFEIVSQDDGTGGTSPNNNREYGGYIDNGVVYETSPGMPADPSIKGNKATIQLKIGFSTFHSHPSGNSESYYDELGNEHTPCFTQFPTEDDRIAAGNYTCYVFGRRDSFVYVYNSSGIQTIIYQSAFINKFNP